METLYTLHAEREPSGRLRIGYPSEELAVAAAEVIFHLWESITITAPDGSLVLKMESARP
jgi:hypothetical protein